MALEEQSNIQVFVGVEYFTEVPITNTDQLIENVKNKVKNEKGIAIDKQRIYYEGKPLQERQALLEGDILFVEDPDSPTEERNWSVDVYGYSNGAVCKVTVSIPYSSYITDLGLKILVHQKQNTLQVDNQTLYHEGDVLPEGKPLKTCEFWDNGVILFVEDTRNPIPRRDWSIVVCGDFDDSPITVSVPFPSLTTAEVLKKSIENKTKVLTNEQTLYYEDNILPEDTSLVECDGMKNGAAIYLAIKPVTINISVVHHPGANGPFQVKIPQKEFKEWKVSFLREAVCSKFGFDINSNHILAVAGKTLTNDTMIKDQPEIKDGCNVTFTILQHALLPTPTGLSDRKLTVPAYSSFKIKSREALYERNLRYSPVLSSRWTVHVINRREEKSIALSDCQFTPIFTLRKLIEEKIPVPSYQQKLTAGTTVLEDWDKNGKVLLLCNYPSIYDGVTIELEDVTEGIHVKLSGVDNEPLKISPKNVIIQKNPQIPPPNYINIPNPGDMTVHMLMNIMKNCGLSEEEIYKKSVFRSGYIPISDNPISSVKSISNGCVLKTSKPSVRKS